MRARRRRPLPLYRSARAAPHTSQPAGVRLEVISFSENQRKAFALYLTQMHARIHAIFSDQHLATIAQLPPEGPVNDKHLFARIEIVIDASSGGVSKAQLLRSSGVPDFDRIAIDSVNTAQPFERAPDSIASSDGNVYIDWEFRRDDESCSPRRALPHIFRP